MKKFLRIWILLGCAVTALTRAQEAEAKVWTYTLTPYVWMSGLNGTVGVGGVEAKVDESFGDLLDKIDWALMMAGEMHNGSWGLFADVQYIDLAERVKVPAGTLRAGVEQTLLTFGASARVAEDEVISADLGAGARYTDLQTSLRTPVGNGSGSSTWLDPLLFSRVRLQMSERFFMSFTGDIGGFGVGSDLTWKLGANVGYQYNDAFVVLLGYRHLDVDAEDSGVTYDIATRGFGLGMQVIF